MAPPTCAPSAAQLSEACFDKYKTEVYQAAPQSMRSDLPRLADLLFEGGNLQNLLIDQLIPDSAFDRDPNAGHSAVADFLLCRAAQAAVSTNVDAFIERSLGSSGTCVEGALHGDEINHYSQKHSPLLKLHGCWVRDKWNTVWTVRQLESEPTKHHIKSSRTWLKSALRSRHLLVIGFWSDWAYLNSIVENTLEAANPACVTLVNPAEPADLRTKAPGLWALATERSHRFVHVKESGADFLEAVRREFSLALIRMTLDRGGSALQLQGSEPLDDDLLQPPQVPVEDLYRLRQDLEGKPSTEPATDKSGAGEAIGCMILILRRAGAVYEGSNLRLGAEVIRVVSGASRTLARMKSFFADEPPTSDRSVTMVVCVGAMDLGLPRSVVRKGQPGHLVRAEPVPRWLTDVQAREELSL